MLIESNFKPAWWLANRHLQTIVAKWLKRNENIDTTNETLELPDGDFLDLAWTENPDSTPHKPIVIILHGLQGSVNSHYIQGIFASIKQSGWIGVLMHFRGCSGRPNRQDRSYHSGDTRDISFLTHYIHQQYPHRKLAAVGYSLGGNVLARYLATTQNNPLQAATIVCAPLNLARCSDKINHGFAKVYQKYLVDMLKTMTFEKLAINQLATICPKKLESISTMRDFDHYVTAPINGFNSADDYYERASGAQGLKQIKQPCLIIHADDDPFLCENTAICLQQLPSHITAEVTKGGGHVGFVEGNLPFNANFWLERRIPNYLKHYLT